MRCLRVFFETGCAVGNPVALEATFDPELHVRVGTGNSDTIRTDLDLADAMRYTGRAGRAAIDRASIEYDGAGPIIVPERGDADHALVLFETKEDECTTLEFAANANGRPIRSLGDYDGVRVVAVGHGHSYYGGCPHSVNLLVTLEPGTQVGLVETLTECANTEEPRVIRRVQFLWDGTALTIEDDI